MFTLTVLGSGSAGNAALVTTDRCRLLLDGGLSARQLVTRLGTLGLQPDALDGILLTHEHGDHAGGLEVLCRRWPEVPLFCTRLTGDALRHAAGPESALARHAHWRYFGGGKEFTVGDLTVASFPVPHDAAEPVGFVLHQGATAALGFLTDLGHATKLVIERVREATTLLLEANHDEALLAADTKRPWSVKQRITSRHGHLSNAAAAEVVARLLEAGGGRLRRTVLGHLSRDCNRPDLAIAAVRARAEGAELECVCAAQGEVGPAFTIEEVAATAIAEFPKAKPPREREREESARGGFDQLDLFAA